MLPHLKSVIMINTYCLLKINFKVNNFLQVSQGLKLALEKVQWIKMKQSQVSLFCITEQQQQINTERGI